MEAPVSFSPPSSTNLGLSQVITWTLSIDATDPLNLSSFRESFYTAQRGFIPFYLISQIQFNDGPSETYDSASFHNWKISKGTHQVPLESPLSRRLIDKIHYFALPCFNFDAETMNFKPVTLSGEKEVEMTTFLVDQFGEDHVNLFLDGMNHHTSGEGSVEEKECQRLIQRILSAEYAVLCKGVSLIYERVLNQKKSAFVVLDNTRDLLDIQFKEVRLALSSTVQKLKTAALLWMWCSKKGEIDLREFAATLDSKPKVKSPKKKIVIRRIVTIKKSPKKTSLSKPAAARKLNFDGL